MAPRLPQIAATFTLVSLLCVLSRFLQPGAIATIVAGLVWKPYFAAVFLLAALSVWLGPTTLFWTEKPTASKAVWSVAVFWTAALLLSVQKFDPFIYFIF